MLPKNVSFAVKKLFKLRYSLQLCQNSFFRNFSSGNEVDIKLPLFSPILDPKWADRLAFTDHQGQNYTYSELGGKSLALAKELLSNGEERVAFLVDRDIIFPTTLYATWAAKHTAVPLSSSHPENMLEYFVKSTGAKRLVCTRKHADKMNRVAKATNSEILVVDYSELKTSSEKYAADLLKPTVYSGKNALILFTSGTTGLPKGVLLTHTNLHAQVLNICQAWEITGIDTMLHVLPLHHTHGLIHALISPLAVGARCHMLEKFDAEKAWIELLSNESQRPNVLMAVPTVYVKMIEEYEKTYGKSKTKAEFLKETCKSKMRVMISGSAALPVPVLETWERITSHRLLERYGMTEIGMALTNPLHGERRAGFVGGTFQSVKVRVADLTSTTNYKVLAEGDWKFTDVKADKNEQIIGDLLIKGPSVFKEYWGNPEATKKEFTDDGWFITGDTVEYVNKYDSYKILGRKSVDIIKSGGYKLSALEIETQLLSLPEIKEVAIMGLPDPTWGQKVAAVVVWTGKELSAMELKELAKTRLAPYACPTVLKTMDELPRNHLGKVNKKELVKIFN